MIDDRLVVLAKCLLSRGDQLRDDIAPKPDDLDVGAVLKMKTRRLEAKSFCSRRRSRELGVPHTFATLAKKVVAAFRLLDAPIGMPKRA